MNEQYYDQSLQTNVVNFSQDISDVINKYLKDVSGPQMYTCLMFNAVYIMNHMIQMTKQISDKKQQDAANQQGL